MDPFPYCRLTSNPKHVRVFIVVVSRSVDLVLDGSLQSRTSIQATCFRFRRTHPPVDAPLSTPPPARPCLRHRHVLLCPIADDLRHCVQGRLGPQRGGRAAGQGHARARGYTVRSRQRSAMPVRGREPFSAVTIYAASRPPQGEVHTSLCVFGTHAPTHAHLFSKIHPALLCVGVHLCTRTDSSDVCACLRACVCLYSRVGRVGGKQFCRFYRLASRSRRT